MELGTGCLACRNQIVKHVAVCLQIWNCCFSLHSEDLNLDWFLLVALEILPFLPLWQCMNELDLARQPYMAVQWLADRWYSSGWHMKIYGFQFVRLRVLFRPFNLAWNSWSTFGRKSAPTFWFSYGTGNVRKWTTQSHPMDLLKHTAQVLPIYAGFCPICLFFHFIASRLP